MPSVLTTAVAKNDCVFRLHIGDRRTALLTPCVCPARVRETRAGTFGKMSGSWASRITGASSSTFASVPDRSSTPSNHPRPRTNAIWSPSPASQTA